MASFEIWHVQSYFLQSNSICSGWIRMKKIDNCKYRGVEAVTQCVCFAVL